MRRDKRIDVRVTAEEKALLITAAGGQRQLSSWIRDLALDAVGSNLLDQAKDLGIKIGGGEQQTESSEAVSLVSDAQPSAQSDLPAAVVSDKALPVPNAAKPAKKKEECARWAHHRKGTYCGTCQKVQ